MKIYPNGFLNFYLNGTVIAAFSHHEWLSMKEINSFGQTHRIFTNPKALPQDSENCQHKNIRQTIATSSPLAHFLKAHKETHHKRGESAL
ncbi:hypothetical protein [Vibrio nomapromontoriensis]|uniref:hypothetical protein n=1 Tax=Vibrio nomapromontoriensis TaxID=2910246 RepID=UPI003D0A511C